MKIVVTEPIPAGEYTLVPLSAAPPPPEPEPAPEPPDEEEPPPPTVPVPVPPPTAAASVERHGITFDFTAPAVLGTFANGDPAVIGPVTVAQTWPAWTGNRNGAMVDPVYISETANYQGYDHDLSRFSESVRAKFPLVLRPGQSLVATTSWRAGEPGCPDIATAGPRPTIRHAAVLTCVAALPAPGEFRPPYAAHKGPMFSTDTMIDLGTLPKWPLPTGAPSIASVIDNLSRLWLDHRGMWHQDYIAPSENMPHYSRNRTAELGDAILLLLCDIPLADKHALAIRLCQIGIDQWGVFETGGRWGDGKGGVGSGRRAPVILAGHLLRSSLLRDYFIDHDDDVLCLETFQVQRDEQGVYWREGKTNDRASPGKTSYRKCCTANVWHAGIIAMRALGLESAWNYPDSFEYQDAYVVEAAGFTNAWDRGWHMWHYDLYRATEGGRHAP